MTETAKPTKGEWCAHESQLSRDNLFFIHEPSGVPALTGKKIAECYDKANAALIAEAGTVFHETGKTPRELANGIIAQQNDKVIQAAQIKIITDENKQLRDEKKHLDELYCKEREQNTANIVDNKRLRSDAERYLWLKKNALKSGSEYSDIVFDLLRADNTDNWDASIDQAIAQEPMK